MGSSMLRTSFPKAPSQAAKSPVEEAANVEEGDEEDENEQDEYLTMTFGEPSSTTAKKESLTEATKRKQREAETRGRLKSKSEIAAEEASKRDEALARSTLDASSKGFKMMAKLGYKPGSTLGKRGGNGAGLLEPVGLEMKEGRGGIGADAEKKRKFRQEVEARAEGEKKQKVEEGEYRERQRLEREERRREGHIIGAQKVAERLEEEGELEKDADGAAAPEEGGLEGSQGVTTGKGRKRKPVSQVNVLWRGAIKQRELAERDKRMRYHLHQSLSRIPTYEDPDEEKEDRFALGRKDSEEVSQDLDQEDEELNDFEKLESSEKLQKLVEYLRHRWHYCFWCKYRYVDSSMDGCPGITEDDHD